ncbi:MAG: hypothetical protein NTY75_04750, partial [Candidatus Shapirobacteria bacterium]|nr:hypothetical protein [Candidatus Shapirobacteria bacterium]
MKKERYIFTKRLKLSFIFFLFLFAGFVLQKINDYQDYSPTIIIENSHFKTSIPLDLYQNITAQASFKAEHNFLGIIAVKFNTHQKINDDFLQFSLKEKGQKNWLYTAKYKVDQFQNNEYFPFGFPKITNSKGKTYEIEIKSLLGNNQNYVTLSPFSDDFIIKYDFTKKYLQNNKTKIPIYSLNKAISLIKHLNITSLCFIFFTPLILYIFLNTKPGKALSQCFRYSPPNNLSVKKKRTSLPSLTNPKTKYPNSVYKIFFSFFTLIIFLLIISGLILICNGHIEASEWLIYKICSITTFISAAIFINPRFRVKPIFFKISFLLIITLFLIQ